MGAGATTGAFRDVLEDGARWQQREGHKREGEVPAMLTLPLATVSSTLNSEPTHPSQGWWRRADVCIHQRPGPRLAALSAQGFPATAT